MQNQSGTKLLSLTVILLSIIGLILIFSATMESNAKEVSSIFWKQTVWITLGIILMIMFRFINYSIYKNVYIYLYIVVLFLLILVLFLPNSNIKNVNRWIEIGFFHFQPSELCKYILIIFVARYLSYKHIKMDKITNYIIPIILSLIPIFLIIIEPDFGTAFILIPHIFLIIFLAGAKWKHIFILFLLILIVLPVLWFNLKPYQKKRINIFLNPNLDKLGAGYNVIQSKIAVGSGGFTGKGFMKGSQTKLNFLPEQHTDFIFSVLGEQFGFLGALTTLFLYSIIIFKGYRISYTCRDTFGKLLAAGITNIVLINIFVNIGMTIGLMPVTGLPLKFLSYGGSSVLLSFISIGILNNIDVNK